MAQTQEKKSNLFKILILLAIVGAGIYFYSQQPDSKEKYKVRAAGNADTFGWRASFINLTGKDAEDKKIGLSDDYWEGGKFK